MRAGLVLATLAAGCSAGDGPPVQVIARAGGAGYWPPDSRTAVAGAIELARGDAPIDGLELDVALARDLVPVLSPSPLLDPRRCRRASGALLDEPLPVRSRTGQQLARNVVCGGEPDPAHGQAIVVAEPLVQLAELIRQVRGAPAALDVWLDVRHQPGLTPAPDKLAAAILDPWIRADLPQVLTVTSAQREVLDAFDVRARTLGVDLERWLVHPDPDDAVSDGFAAEVDGWAAGTDYVALAEEAGADGILVRWDLVEPRLVRAARAAGLGTGVWTVDDPRVLQRIVAQREVDVVLTNYPGDAPWSR